MKYKLWTTTKRCRNNGVGDYVCTGYPDWWEIEVTDSKNRKYNKLLLIHELIECMLTEERGIAEHEIDKFDREFEKTNVLGLEPGDSSDAPYQREHQFAEKIEKLLCEEFGIDWKDYCTAIEDLIKSHEVK